MNDEKYIVVYMITDEDGSSWRSEVFDDEQQATEWVADVRYLPGYYPHSIFRLSEATPLYTNVSQTIFAVLAAGVVW